MSAPIVNLNTDTAEAVGPPRLDYPIQGDPVTLILTQDFEWLREKYEPLQLDSQHPDDSELYLVRETDHQSLGAGLLRWSRVYARIPASRREYEQYAYEVPGISTEGAELTRFAIESVALASGVSTITTTLAHSFTVGQFVIITYVVFDEAQQLNIPRAVTRTVGTVPDTTSITVEGIVDSGDITWGQIGPSLAGREPFSKVVLSAVFYDYFLPGVSTDVERVGDIELFQSADIRRTSDGSLVKYYSTLTTPTLSEYHAMVVAGSLIVAESSMLTRWMGNIYQRSTRYVVAI